MSQYSNESVFYDSTDFDAAANAIEAGLDNPPLYYASSIGGFGDTPPSINVQGGDTTNTNGPLTWLLLGIILYLLWR